MAEKGGDPQRETEAWNVAEGFTKIKVLRHLITMDRWEVIAEFGTEEIDEANILTEKQIAKRRVEALQRLYSTLKQLIGNVLFALRKGDQAVVKTYLERLKNIEDVLSEVYSVEEDDFDGEVFEINEKLFKLVREILHSIKDELNTPLNNAGLIFRTSEEVDLDKIMNDLVEGG